MGKKTRHICGRCLESFKSRSELDEHMRDHADSEPLEHRCTQAFDTQTSYDNHRKHGQPCCDAIHSRDWKHSPRSGYIDPDKPKPVSREALQLEYGATSAGTRSDMSEVGMFCHCCKKTFASHFRYDSHLLGCTAANKELSLDTPPKSPNLRPLQTTTQRAKTPVPQQPLSTSVVSENAPPGQEPGRSAPAQAQAPAVLQAPRPQHAGAGTFVCNKKGCQRSYNSEPGLKMHMADAHGAGGSGLDLYGSDSWMLTQRERERLKAEGLLKNSTNGSRGGKNGYGRIRGGFDAPPPAASRTLPRAAPAPRMPLPATHRPHQAAPRFPPPPAPLPTSQDIGGPLEMEQAKSVCGKTLRLLLQTDVFIRHDGKVSVSGIDWTRIGVERQSAVVGIFEGLCHLPRSLQAVEYLPAPKTFLTEYTAHYPTTEFESAPARNQAKPALGIIAMACSKIVLGSGCHEVVKIAAVDVLTCRVLMSHLVCTDPDAQVANWNSSNTGLNSFSDLENARQVGYRVLKGWAAARAALFKFVDQETIIVGHNLRSELDALRVIHGRAVDIVKVVEKAAKGPLSKAQVSLDSWCRDVANVANLKTDPVFGRDCVMNAFAVREIGLWSIKNRETFEKVAKKKTTEYQSVMKM
ncbi:hypothetical protein C7974DRAFT_440828 [Boeremia exigua]|uniref:uncharacterized protein n=1 Tax=Boeremia exigua TaxID=749465 RepID=UPI001E8E31AC|nr:uncharacterized protein C7974DRAFT_440828 [Boeremia exigua]KAH6618531.1 hypothetical protein C7974DRAFT_440828 [Boeremia exigua]